MDDVCLKGGRDFMYAADFIISIKRTEPDEGMGVLPIQRCGKSKEVEKQTEDIEALDSPEKGKKT